jgi:hypothetical protein
MVKRLIQALFFSCLLTSASGQLKSPEEFLGYRIGTRFTPHWKIVNYFNHVAAQASSNMKLQSYGETYEGRPLIIAFISSKENMSRLEAIRYNNLRLAHLATGAGASDPDNPAIVWLSYNVHGNETSSSEAAMMTLFALVDPSNTQTKPWLNNTVVIIDPCINPDGRDRYVNWFNSVVGEKMNPTRFAREHREPWPGGRTNHYNFDLNRDWAWQTQTESQSRIKIYYEWMPQIHVDYHEQEIDQPYYFAPAVQPYHDVITTWQRDFQNTIGKNNAKYFDANGWLFFTKEIFDLYYPSYGDTYPTFNGAVGMTYEQGGGGAGGLAVLNDEGDTLTLVDRALHHYTTSLSTIEISSKNAKKLVEEFGKFFDDAVQNGVGDYKTYIIRNDPASSERLQILLDLLDKNGIRYGTGSGSGKGFNYLSGKDESFSVNSNDIIVSSFQPRSALVKVLFEPRPHLVDSATYDISAWALPYAYGLTGFATRDRINPTGRIQSAKPVNVETSYGYVLPWKGMQSVKAAGELLQKGILLRYAEQPFEINGTRFDRGSIIILRTANRGFGKDLWNTVRQIADANEVKLYPVSSGLVDRGFDFGSYKVHPIKAPRVAMFTGEGVSPGSAGAIWHFFDKQISYPLTLVNVNDFGRLNLSDFNVIIMPDGDYRFLSEKANLDVFKDWINKGGRVVAIENAVAQLSRAEIGIKQKKSEEEKKDSNSYAALKKYEDRERDPITGTTPGAIFRVELDPSHPLAFGYPGYYFTLKQNDAVYEFMKDGWNVGVVKKDSPVAGFVGAALQPKLKDGLLFGVQHMGNGVLSYFVDDPMFRSFWENGKLMLCNAVFLVGQ